MSKFIKAMEQAGRWELPPAGSPKSAVHSPTPPTMAQPAAEQFHSPVPASSSDSNIEPTARIEGHLVSLLNPASFAAEQYRVLCYAMEQARKDADLQVMAVTSPGVGDGKSTTAINLAGALAQPTAARVLLIEADLRRPSFTEYLGLVPSMDHNLARAVLDSSLTLQDVVRPYLPFNLAVLPAKHPSAAPHEVFQSPRLGELLREARRDYDYVIMDTPPLIPFPDCRFIEKWIDSFLVVVTAHKTPRKLIKEALDAMDPAKIAGFVFNGDHRLVPRLSRRYQVHPRRRSSRR
jgi:capsular exopolysaccharide synthesis family protein